jgi:hypothetical protein
VATADVPVAARLALRAGVAVALAARGRSGPADGPVGAVGGRPIWRRCSWACCCRCPRSVSTMRCRAWPWKAAACGSRSPGPCSAAGCSTSA